MVIPEAQDNVKASEKFCRKETLFRSVCLFRLRHSAFRILFPLPGKTFMCPSFQWTSEYVPENSVSMKMPLRDVCWIQCPCPGRWSNLFMSGSWGQWMVDPGLDPGLDPSSWILWHSALLKHAEERPPARGIDTSSSSCSLVSNSVTPWSDRLLCPWDSPGKNTGLGGHFLLHGIFPTQGSNLGLICLHCRWIHYHLNHQGSPEM